MKTLGNMNAYCKVFSEPMLGISDWGTREKLSSLCQFSELLLYLLRVKQMEIQLTNLLFIYLDLLAFQGL